LPISQTKPDFRVKHALSADDFVRTLSDAELLDRCVQGFRKLRDLIPYIREARRRWAQPGRRVPVPGRPSWTEWITQNLRVTPRRVQQLLKEPSEISSRGQKASPKLGKGDWRALFKLTERQMTKVFGPLESREVFAEAIQNFAQAVADRFGERHGRVEISVAIVDRRRRSKRVDACRPSLARKSRNVPANGSMALQILSNPQSFQQDCGGCSDMHLGIVRHIQKTHGTDEEVARECGVSLAIVRQAKVRHMLLLEGRRGH